jgi:hypothetical protein
MKAQAALHANTFASSNLQNKTEIRFLPLQPFPSSLAPLEDEIKKKN